MELRVKIKTLLFVCLLTPTFCLAQSTRYVTDSFTITMRTGQGTEHKIIKSLKSGTKVVILEENSENGYARVKLDDETEGWVLTRYLDEQPIAKDRLAVASREIDSLKAKLSSLNSQVNDLSGNKSSLEKESNQLAKDNKKLSQELSHIKEIAANQLAINEENKSLKEQLLTLKRDIQSIQQENLSLQDRSARDWFLIGAGVCVIGVVMGLVLPNIRLRRKQSWSSL